MTETVDAILAELDAMVGLGPVKQALRRMADVQRLNADRRAADEPVIEQPLDLVFAGDPGTGEDNVVRIVARLYAALGVLPEVKVAEVARVHLVGATDDDTRTRVGEAVEAARGGVLFVDEAQQLISPDPADPGDVAITALAEQMEGRGAADFAVVLSGPTEAMRLIIQHHPVLARCFDDVIEFPRYTPDELLELFRRRAAELHIEVPDGVAALVAEHLEQVHAGGRFRTARYVPSLVEEMYARMAARALADGVATPDEHRAFAAEDVPPVDQAALADTGLRVGFSAR